MIILTGATGTIGRSLVRLLSERGTRVRALTRDANRAPALRGVKWVQGDLRAPSALPAMFRGVEALFLLTSNVTDTAALQLNPINAAKERVRLAAPRARLTCACALSP